MLWHDRSIDMHATSTIRDPPKGGVLVGDNDR